MPRSCSSQLGEGGLLLTETSRDQSPTGVHLPVASHRPEDRFNKDLMAAVERDE